ncbi:hypothetical protein LZZ90_08955 [Flavobacterium sp. SM15]|uniref:hypothetical protein n=1 Tax=Flavobacterium sp. SM15 TaxID=2908005 RepID=UPI001EDAED5F|nr:hypothetical protein [Flavobacterium sp. SM15]MCG2611634.1 hypothetical protein [Flavobacterium sp. SM15]
MNYITRRLAEIKQNGYQIDLGNLIDESFTNYKKIALLAGLALIIVILSLLILTIFGMSYFIDFENFNEESMVMDFSQFTATEILAYIGGVSLLGMLFAPFTAGLIKLAHDVETKEEVSFSTIFECYKASYLKDLLLSSLLISVITGSIAVAFQILRLDFVGTLLSYFIGFLLSMTIPLIIFGGLSAFQAISNSILVVSKQPIWIFLALLIAAIASCVGLIAFCLGIFFTLPYLYSMYYVIYKNSVGFEEQETFNNL